MAAGIWPIVARNTAIGVAAGVFMALIGALGTGAAPLGQRLFYWVSVMVIGSAFGWAAALLARRATGNPWALWAMITLGLTIPGTIFIWAYTGWVFAGAPRPQTLPGYAPSVVVVSAAMTAIMVLVNRPGAVTHAPPAGVPTTVRFLDRLPAKLKGAVLYAVQAEDHYLRLHTSKGQDLILMRLADAMAELDGMEGAQTHRSWWVAKSAVQGVRRDNGRVALELANGVAAPVSRPNVRPLKAAGWF
ncbi:MAG: hypothetical protein GC189_10905 [Alphaproteobacteria bacterium]|nr:hypothetical protein [Alphaproteobacteria bacterium]